MDIRPLQFDAVAMERYTALFARCFPGAEHLNLEYLRWLYVDNPEGRAFGFDAWSGGELAAHYACIPATARLFGQRTPVMLSLNTATDPKFQGQGLFTKLASATYADAADKGVVAVYGVANANSTHGFLRKLGFSLISPLDAKLGFGRVSPLQEATDSVDACTFRREWPSTTLAWRISSPANPFRLVRLDSRNLGVEAPTGRPGVMAWDELTASTGAGATVIGSLPQPRRALHLHLGLRPQSEGKKILWLNIPNKLRPSPLNLIFRPLKTNLSNPPVGTVRLGQLDFDAF